MVHEFARLEDGRRLLIRNDRGTGLDFSYAANPHWPGRSPEALTELVESVVMPMDKEDYAARYYSPEWIVPRIKRLYDVDIDPQSVLDAVPPPLRVEFGEEFFGPGWPRMPPVQ